MDLQAIYRPGPGCDDWFVSEYKTGKVIAKELTEKEAGELVTGYLALKQWKWCAKNP